jgi:hypothetical protein
MAPTFCVKGDKTIMCDEQKRTMEETNFKIMKSKGLQTDNVARKAEIGSAENFNQDG